MKLRVCTMFSGYDSQCMALDRLKEMHPEFDYELVAWAEIDKYAIMAHNAVYPQWSDRNYGDVSKIDWNQVPDFDLLTYSSPCQDFSNAGLQRGGQEGSGTRSSLLWECRRAIVAKKPKYLMMENVAALVSQKFIGTFNQWQLELERYGYTNFAQVLNAKDYGVPQNRERIFMISILDCKESYYFPKKVKQTIRLKDVLEKEVEERYYLSQQVIDSFNAHKERNAANGNGFGWNPTDGDVIANAILTGSLRPTDNFIAEPKCQVVGTLPYKSGYENTARVYAAEGLAPCIQSAGGGNTQPKVVEPQVLGWVRDEKGNVVKRPPVEVANCVTSGKRDNTQNYVVEPMTAAMKDIEPGISVHPLSRKKEFRGFDTEKAPALRSTDYKCPHCINNGYRIRKLTERECFRLMGVRDEDSDKIRAAVSKSQCYKLAGNSIVVDVMVRIFDQLLFGNKNKNQQLEIF